MITNNDSNTELDSHLADMFMKAVRITLSNDVICMGRLTLFKHKNYEYVLSIVSLDGKHKEKISMPYPFGHWVLNNGEKLMFDYRMNTLFNGDQELLSLFKRVRKPNKSKFFDTIAYIDLIPESIESA